MWNTILTTRWIYLYLFAGTIASTAAGYASGNKVLLPVLQIAVSYPVLFSLLKLGKRKRAIGTMLFWALCMAVVGVWSATHFQTRAEESIFYGKHYADEMLNWIRTGQGPEGDPARFIPQHLLHFFAFVLLSMLSGSILSLLMGALLMNYMCFYVGTLINASTDPWTATMMGWQPYAIIRVCSYVILGVILGEPMICRITGARYEYEEVRPFFWAGLTGVILDIAIKMFLAPWWGNTLRALL